MLKDEEIKEEETYVVCVFLHDFHNPKSKKVKCCKCGAGLWCSAWNLHLSPICLKCVRKIPGEKEVMIKRKDWESAMKVIGRLRKLKNG